MAPHLPPRKPTYWEYIKVEELLGLQTGIDGDEAGLGNDEVRFIIIHQIDELWFKIALRELTSARDLFRQAPVPETALGAAAAALRRVALVFELAAHHFKLMETMRTQDYLQFRDKLSPASGFQSAQLREIEILLGLEARDRIPFGHEGSYLDALRSEPGAPSPARRRVERRLADRPSLKEAIYAWLARAPIDGSRRGDAEDDRVVDAFIAAFLESYRRAVQHGIDYAISHQALTSADVERLRARQTKSLADAQAFLQVQDVADPAESRRLRTLRAAILYVESNRSLPLLSWPCEIIDAVIEAEQAMLVFRQRHARMVERVIGRRLGTGGSDGVDYLDQTALRYRVFKEIWAVRTLLLEPGQTPPARNPEFYGLRGE
jgi:tryptophan 2,3-dioxygenase